jgi:heme exporter protein C
MKSNNWWKFLGVVLVVYTLIAGLLIPLKPGIVDRNTNQAKTGTELIIKVRGYNADYTQYANAQAWLKLDSVHAIKAKQIRHLDKRTIQLSFSIPTSLPDTSVGIKDMTLVIDDPKDGTSILPNAISLSLDSVGRTQSANGWDLIIKDTHKHPSVSFPFRTIIYETIRNLYYHVPMWFTMFAMLGLSVWYAVKYLNTSNELYDLKSKAYADVGTFFGILGLLTGAIWAKHTWGDYFPMDVKLINAAVAVLIYMAYFVLRGSFEDDAQASRISAIYNIFGFASLPALLFIIPRLTNGLHPGNGGNPAFGSQDLDNSMRLVFYPACIGWILIGLWIVQLMYRTDLLNRKTLLEN